VKVTSSGTTPQSVEVTVIPLQDASNADTVATYVGGPQSATATLLQDDNVVVFALVPSNFPGLSNPINYRIMWRVGGVTGRTESYDFAMPDVDVSFDQLQSTGNIIDGQAYLQQSDLGVAGRVARLNDDGKVVDALGEPVATLSDVASVQGSLNTAVTNLEQQAETQHSAIYGTIDYKTNTLTNSLNGTLQQAISGWSNSLRDESNSRVLADSNITSTLNSLSSAFTTSRNSFSSSLSTINTTLTTKADIDESGYVPLSQIPPEAITNWIPLTRATERLTLIYPDDIQLGDLVLTPTGVYGLTGTDPSSPSSWYLLSQIQSVNAKTGAVVLSAADVGALAVGDPISQSQITGLPTVLDSLALKATTTSLQDQITTITNDSTIVRLNASGYVSHLLLNEYVAYVNVLGQITKKDGTVISDPANRGVLSVNGRTGSVTLIASDVGAIATSAVIPQSQINGLVSALTNKADLSSGKILVAQLPFIPQSQITGLTDALAAKAGLVSGVVPLVQLPSFPLSKVDGLSLLVSGNQLTSSSNAINRITGLESRVLSIETTGGGGGGGGGTTAITSSVYWGGSSSGDVLQQNFSSITLASPFGIYSTGINAGTGYYNKDGVPSGDAAFPVVTPAGHLKLYKWNESAPADIEYALASSLSTLSETVRLLGIDVGTKALSSDLLAQKNRIDSLYTAASNKADLDPILKTLLPAQIPFSVKPNPRVVASTSAMKSLTISQVHAGDICIVTGAGTYTLLGSNPGAINNVDGWALHPGSVSGGGSGTVVSLSGPLQNKIYPDSAGNIALQASDIGAATSASLSNYVTSTDYTTGLSGKTNTNDVYSAIGSSQLVKTRVDYVVRQFTIGGQTYCATGVPVTTVGTVTAPSGSSAVIDKDPYNQPINPVQNALVLLTNQPDSKYNGIWKVNTGGQWVRPDGYLSGNKVFPGTLVIVNNRVTPEGLGAYGSANYTVWQNIALAVIDSTTSGINGATTWRNLGSIAPISVTGENGIAVSGTYPDIRIGSDAAGGFVRKFNTTTTPTSPTYTVTHGLNTPYPQVTVIDSLSGAAVLVGWKVDAPSQITNRYDSVTLEFSNLSYANSYRISVQG
jgi:hypothetical protein